MRVSAVRSRLPALTWVQKSLLLGAVLFVAWETAPLSPGIESRVVHEVLFYLVGPLALGLAYGEHMGWQVTRASLRNTLLLTVFVLPFYLVGSSLPSIRAHYPMWPTSTAMSVFLPHALMQFTIALAAETYFRGLLCVGVRDLGRKAVFISPVVYAFQHIGKPPIELVLSAPTDVLFGWVDYESESILPSVVAHGVGLNLLDWLVLHDPLFPPEQVVSWFSWLPVTL